VHSRYALYAQRWNSHTGSVYDRLPDIVLVEILHWIPLETCVRFGSVSRKWYSLVSTPSLWTTIELKPSYRTSTEQREAHLTNIMAKSHNLTLHIFVDGVNLTKGITDLIRRNMHRMGELHVIGRGLYGHRSEVTNKQLAALLTEPAPRLETFRCIPGGYREDEAGTYIIPSFVCPDSSPCKLSVLELGSFALPTTMQCIPSVTHFTGHIDNMYTNAQKLFSFFPNLLSLRLSLADTQPSMAAARLPEGAYPTTLREVNFSGTWPPEQCASLEDNLPAGLRNLALGYWTNTLDFPFRYFQHTIATQWSFFTYSLGWREDFPRIQVTLQEDHLGKGGARHKCILSANDLSVFLTSSAGRELVTHNANLTYAQVTNELFDAFLLAKVELSTLTTFVLVLTKPTIYGLPRPASSTSKRVNLMTGATPMKLPQLREFIVDNPSPGSCERMILKWAAQHLPDQLPFIFELPKGRLQRLEVVGFASSAEVILHDWTEFVNAADEAYVRRKRMGLKYDLPIHAE